MARDTGLIPDLYFPDEDQELQTSSVEGQKGRGQGGEVKKMEPVDLSKEGFIPIHKLTLEDLPEPIRDEKHLHYILGVSKNVVKINNICLSSKRPDDDQFKRNKQKSLSGSGYLLKYRDDFFSVTTNKHVLFNEDELLTSTFDIFYDYHPKDPADKKKLCKRSVRKDGKYFLGKYSKHDIAEAAFFVKKSTEDHIMEHYMKHDVIERFKLFEHRAALELDWNGDPPVACLISHPLGQPKHVSFGEMVDFDLPSRILYHSAPSKPGSSGGLLVVFSGGLVGADIFHVGTDPRSKIKYARVQYKISSPLDVGVANFEERAELPRPEDEIADLPDEYFLSDGEIADESWPSEDHTSDTLEGTHPPLDPVLESWAQVPNPEDVAEELAADAGAFLEITSLAPFAPIFGAFLLHAEERNLAGLDKGALKPCRAPPADASSGPQGLKQSVKDVVQKLVRVTPSLSPSDSKSLSDHCDLVSFLESQGPCYCQSIVKIVMEGIKLEDGTVTECFLSPYTAAAKMSSDTDLTWPWLKGEKSGSAKDEAVEGCLLKKCLKHGDEDIVPALMIVLIAKANMCLKDMCLQTEDAPLSTTSADRDGQWETVSSKTTQQEKKHAPWEVRNPLPPTETKQLNSSAADRGNWPQLSEDLLTVVYFTVFIMIGGMSTIFSHKCQGLLPSSGEEGKFPIMYTRCLALIEHAFQHERNSTQTQSPGLEVTAAGTGVAVEDLA